jgi:hypothetical protein
MEEYAWKQFGSPGAFDVAGMYGRAVVTPPPGTAERCFKRCT